MALHMLRQLVLYALQKSHKKRFPAYLHVVLQMLSIFSMVLINDRSWTDPDFIFHILSLGLEENCFHLLALNCSNHFLVFILEENMSGFKVLTLETWCLDSEKSMKVSDNYRKTMMIMMVTTTITRWYRWQRQQQQQQQQKWQQLRWWWFSTCRIIKSNFYVIKLI